MSATPARDRCRPCPCCGSSNLYAGSTSATSQGVRCMKCGLQLSGEVPSRWPRGVKHQPDPIKALDALLLSRAVKAWNRRARA